MGRKNGRKPPNIRDMMKGLKNRWGRFQCPRDGSICRSLEAWHWHRMKYHPTQTINFVELSDDDDENIDGREPGKRKSPSARPHSHISSVVGLPHHLHLPPLSPSERLLPPEAFAPLRPEVTFPDDVSDLTEPDIPVLLSEEPTTVAPPCDQKINNSFAEVVGNATQESPNKSKNCEQDPILNNGSPHRHQRIENNSEPKGTVRSSCSQEKFPESRFQEASKSLKTPPVSCHSNCRSSSNDSAVANSNSVKTFTRMTTDKSSIFKMISMQVVEMFKAEKRLTAEEALPQLEVDFSRWGLSHDVLMGIVTGTLVAAMDQWKHGYEVGWRDGAKEVLHAPFLEILSRQRHSPDGVALSSPSETHKTIFRHPGARDDLEPTLNPGQGPIDHQWEHDQSSLFKVRNRERGSTKDRPQQMNNGHHSNDFNNNSDNGLEMV